MQNYSKQPYKSQPNPAQPQQQTQPISPSSQPQGTNQVQSSIGKKILIILLSLLVLVILIAIIFIAWNTIKLPQEETANQNGTEAFTPNQNGFGQLSKARIEAEPPENVVVKFLNHTKQGNLQAIQLLIHQDADQETFTDQFLTPSSANSLLNKNFSFQLSPTVREKPGTISYVPVTITLNNQPITTTFTLLKKTTEVEWKLVKYMGDSINSFEASEERNIDSLPTP